MPTNGGILSLRIRDFSTFVFVDFLFQNLIQIDHFHYPSLVLFYLCVSGVTWVDMDPIIDYFQSH